MSSYSRQTSSREAPTSASASTRRIATSIPLPRPAAYPVEPDGTSPDEPGKAPRHPANPGPRRARRPRGTPNRNRTITSRDACLALEPHPTLPRPTPEGEDRVARPPHPVRAVHRARCLRLRVRVRHRRAPVPRHRPGRPHGPGQPGAPRRQRLRAQHRRWGGDPDRGAARVPPRRGPRRRRGPARERRPWRGDGLPAARHGQQDGRRGLLRADPRRRGPGAPRLARRPHGPDGPRRVCLGQPSGHPPGVHRPAGRPPPGRGRGPRLRAPPVRRPPPGREGRPAERSPRPRGVLRPVHELPDHRLQGDAQRVPAADVLPGPARPAVRERRRPRPLALLHEHLPVLGPRAPVPLHLPQRRDQHAPRQRELDVRAPVHLPVLGLRRGPAQGAPGRGRGRLGHRHLRQRPGAAPPVRPLAGPRDGDDGPGAVEPGPVDVAGPQGVLRVPRVPDGALGRPGVAGVHRRGPDRRHAGPQRAAARPLLGHPRRARGHGVGVRRAGHPVPPTSWPRAGCSPAGCSWWTRPRAGSSATTSSRTRSRPRGRTRRWSPRRSPTSRTCPLPRTSTNRTTSPSCAARRSSATRPRTSA